MDFILQKNPDVVMMDIRIPKLSGLEVVEQVRQKGYLGKIIILSGFSDFKYAQQAIRFGVEYYLTKPIDEDELTETILKIGEGLDKEAQQQKVMTQYLAKVRNSILSDLLEGTSNLSQKELIEINLYTEDYQVVIYEKYSHYSSSPSYRFSDLLKVTNDDNSSYESIVKDNNEILLLKGTFILNKFQEFLNRYEREVKPQVNSPLDSLFITYGRVVNSPADIHISYQEALRLLQRRFFCEHRQHTIGYDQLPDLTRHGTYELTSEKLQNYCERLTSFIQAAKRNQMAEALNELENDLYYATEDIPKIRLYLTDLYLSIKERLSHLYHNESIPFPGNAEIIKAIGEKYYLYEIILFFTEQFEVIMHAIGNPSSNSVMDDIIHYIEHNYMDNIKLETIAPLFGYNSSYLGKIFNKKVGMGFNMYVDLVRINQSKNCFPRLI